MNLMGQDKSPRDYGEKEKVTISVTALHMCYRICMFATS